MKQLAEHQKRILALMDERDRLGIFAEAGTGKTMIALTYIYNHLISGDINDALVVCPASLVPSWRLAIDRMEEFGYSAFDIDLMHDAVKLSSYQKVWKGVKKAGRRTYALRDDIDKVWGCIIVDESHKLGDPSSVQTRMMLKLASHTDRRFIMTGTPDSTQYTKLYGQLRFLFPMMWKSYHDFDIKYVISKNIFHKPIRYDVDALEDLKKRYGTVARLSECFDMPDSIEIDVPVELGAESVYHDFLDFDFSGYNIAAESAGIRYTKMLQCCSGFYLDDDGTPQRVACHKADALLSIVEGTSDKAVVFCSYRESVNIVCEALDKNHISFYRFDGTVKDPVWQAFQKDDTRVIVVQFQRGSEGIDLFASNCMIFYEPTNQACLLEQSKARIMRKGQTRHCRYHFIYTEGTLEERAMRSVRAGVDVSRALLDKWAADERDKKN